MPNVHLTKLARAIRAQLGTSTSIAVGVALISTTAAHAKAVPQLLPETTFFHADNAVTNRELVFVDADVPEPEQLLVGLKQGVEIITLNHEQDGIEQITRVLDARADISAVHIVAHGQSGSLTLGSTRLDSQGLSDRAKLLQRWFKDNGQDNPDVLLYACDVARGEDGAAFVQQLAILTGADIAASTDKTGMGGDWDLEYNIGKIDTPLAFKEEDMLAYPHSLATFTVTKTADTADGTCDTDCSLREAVVAANAAAGIDTIVFDPAVTGTITLTLGQINITDDLVMNGPGAATLAISGGNTSRIFEGSFGVDFTLRDLTLRDANASGDGGAIRSNHGILRVEDSVITENSASSDGGGIYADEGDVYIIRSEISNNYAGDDGGGIFRYNDGESDYLTIVDSLITGNTADGDGGGIAIYADDDGGTNNILNSVISNNEARGEGGGLWIYSDDEGYYTYITDSTISNNTAGRDGGGMWIYHDDDGYIVINNSTISGNSAAYDGGGIFIDDADRLEINNSTISSNTAVYDGGGIFLRRGRAPISNSTIVFNSAGDQGGGIRNLSLLYVENSIIAENTAPNGPDVSTGNYLDTFEASFSLIGDTSDSMIIDSGGNILDTPSGVSPTLVNAGGPTMVHLLDAGSPAIDAGQPGSTGFDYDQRGIGFPRVIGPRVDMGAVEMPSQYEAIPVPTLQNWALILLGLLLPGLALRWRGKLEKRQVRINS